MITADNDHAAIEIYRLWKEIYRLWEDTNTNENRSKQNSALAIEIITRLLDLVDEEKEPHDYCVALRMRAQNYCLISNYNNALDDLYREREINHKRNDHLRVNRCDELISQIEDMRIEEDK